MIGADVFSNGKPPREASPVFKHLVPTPDECTPGTLKCVVGDPLKPLSAQSAESPEVVLHCFKRVRILRSGQVVQRARDEERVHHVDDCPPADSARGSYGVGVCFVSNRVVFQVTVVVLQSKHSQLVSPVLRGGDVMGQPIT